MANYPSLSTNPVTIDETQEDAVIRSSSEAGYVTTRPRFTKVRRIFSINYDALTISDQSTLDTFYTTTLGSGSAIFVWTHPVTSVAYNVRFAGPIKYSPNQFKLFDTQFELNEV